MLQYSMSTLFFLTNQNTQAVSTERHLLQLRLVTRQPTRHFLALPIAIRNIKMPQHAKHQHHNSIINNNNNYKKGEGEIPTLILFGAPPLLKCTKKEETTCNFCTFPVTNYFYLHNTYVLTP